MKWHRLQRDKSNGRAVGVRHDLFNNQLADMKDLEELTQLKELSLYGNPDLTKAQIDQLQKALPNCNIDSNPTK